MNKKSPTPMMCVSCECRPAMPSGLCEACALEEEEHYAETGEDSEVLKEFEQYKRFNGILGDTTSLDDDLSF